MVDQCVQVSPGQRGLVQELPIDPLHSPQIFQGREEARRAFLFGIQSLEVEFFGVSILIPVLCVAVGGVLVLVVP